MTTAVKIINLGLSKIAASRVSSISPPKTPLERFMADAYPSWRDEEMSKRRWRFAMKLDKLTLTDTLTGVDKPYQFLLPNDCLRPLRDIIGSRTTEWEQRGRYLYSAYPDLQLYYMARVSEADFDPLFVSVLAGKIAFESCEYVTQSNQKKADANVFYRDALREASANHGFITGAEIMNNAVTDEGYSFIEGRY